MRNLDVYIECNGNMINVGSITGHNSDDAVFWTPDSFIINLNDKENDFLFATERYDRKILDTSKELMGKKVPLRLHQEDFAQALGITASQKYEKNGKII